MTTTMKPDKYSLWKHLKQNQTRFAVNVSLVTSGMLVVVATSIQAIEGEAQIKASFTCL